MQLVIVSSRLGPVSNKTPSLLLQKWITQPDSAGAAITTKNMKNARRFDNSVESVIARNNSSLITLIHKITSAISIGQQFCNVNKCSENFVRNIIEGDLNGCDEVIYLNWEQANLTITRNACGCWIKKRLSFSKALCDWWPKLNWRLFHSLQRTEANDTGRLNSLVQQLI